MSDYIKREDAIDYLTTNMNWFDADGIETSEEEKRADITELVNGVSSADVAPVVRCKDCVWWTKQEASCQGRCARLGIYPTGAWYCANGAKMDEEKEDA